MNAADRIVVVRRAIVSYRPASSHLFDAEINELARGIVAELDEAESSDSPSANSKGGAAQRNWAADCFEQWKGKTPPQ